MTFVSALFTPTLSPRAHQLCSASSWKPVFRCKWGSKMPKGFSHKKRHTAPDGPGPGRPRKPLEDDHGKQRRRCLTHSELAELMWSPFKVFEHHLRAELELYPELHMVVKEAVLQHRSSYGMQQRGGQAALERHSELVDLAATGIVAQVRRLGNARDIPLVVAARSLSWLMSMARSKHWVEERRMRRLVDRSVAMDILARMTALAPPPPFRVNPLVKLAFVDQTYMQNYHYGSRRHVRVEHLDAGGQPVQREWDVYVNAVSLPIPAALAALDASDLRQLVTKGPYTEDPSLALLPQLQPAVVAAHRRAFAVRSSARVLSAATALGRTASQLEAEDITIALLRRPAVDPGGPTHLDFLPVLPRTDTKSYRDMIQIITHLEQNLGRSFVLVVMGDGQTVLRLRDLKKKHGALYKHVLIANGNFHSFSHFLFAAHEMFFDALSCWAARLLGKQRLLVKVLKDLEDNNYYHVLELFLPLTSAIYVYLIKHVTQPPAHLFLTSPEAYLRMHSALDEPVNQDVHALVQMLRLLLLLCKEALISSGFDLCRR